jgi:predicted ABC-type ATPase
MSPPHSPRIYVLAGVNGAGKSSIGGAVFRAAVPTTTTLTKPREY